MSDEPREITDDLRLSELTVGEFKQLMLDLLVQAPSTSPESADNAPEPVEKINVRRKSLDEFMNDLGSS
ncbi:MAG: hypothetical protein ACFE0Q_06430 [Anaerolineae bacterium]